jgi:3-phosphoglycerate kinase
MTVVVVVAEVMAAEIIQPLTSDCVPVLNLLDWGPSSYEYLAAALYNSVCICANGENTVELTAFTDGYCSVVKWDSNEDKLIIGTNNSVIKLRIMLEQLNIQTHETSEI